MNNENFLEFSEFHCIKISIDLQKLTTARSLDRLYLARNSVVEITRHLNDYLKSNDAYLGLLSRELDNNQYEVEFKYKDKHSCKDIESNLKLIFKEMLKNSEETRGLKGLDLYPDNYYQIFNSLLLETKLQSDLPIKDETSKKPKI